jgi:hypothetical protein
VIEVQDQRRAREIDLEERLNALAAVRKADPMLHPIHANLGRLASQLGSQCVQIGQSGQVTHLLDRLRVAC